MKYIKVEWPEIQEYMDNPGYPKESYFDPVKDTWFIPEEWELSKESCLEGGEIGDLDDAMG